MAKQFGYCWVCETDVGSLYNVERWLYKVCRRCLIRTQGLSLTVDLRGL